MIERNEKGRIIICALNLGGSVEIIQNPVAVAELAVEKGATTLLMLISSRKQLFDLSDEMATKINIEFYSEAIDVFIKAIMD